MRQKSAEAIGAIQTTMTTMTTGAIEDALDPTTTERRPMVGRRFVMRRAARRGGGRRADGDLLRPGRPCSDCSGLHRSLRHGDGHQRAVIVQHSGPNMASLAPGERGQLIWKFTRTGTVTFACLQSGHLEAGMRGAVAVQ
jgi:hypothetical protein